ncbi:alpha/beta-hydrolase [Phlegmacium glaucopus]|nr:alpha/beta-hydrolase [Phlegmacium glaucopus]
MWSLTRNLAYFVLYIAPSVYHVTAVTPTVDLGYARYQGVPSLDIVNNATNTQFLAIRYAAAPTGFLRFREPQLPSYTPGVQLANKQPSQCLQAVVGATPKSPFRNVDSTIPNTKRLQNRNLDVSLPEASEDCLFLNVYVPGNFGERKNLPVVVWIHGGGYVRGNASLFNGNNLLREAGGGVVAVIIQYRLGLFGFLPGEKVKKGGALNAGLLDQQAALQWVQKYISKFGGDPGLVTIWGESAGAGSVLQQVIANGGNTRPALFRAAITSSTFLPSQYNFNDPIPEALYSEVVNQTNCASAKDTFECLRGADVNALQTANVNINHAGFFGTFTFVPVVDGSFITKRPTQLMQAGKLNGGIVLTVTNAFEGTVFVNQNTASTVQIADYVSQLYPNFGTAQINAAVAQYAGLGTNIFQADAIMGESIFICPTYYLLRAFDGRAFKGEFSVPPALHGQDGFFYFPAGKLTFITTFGKSFSESFLNFVMTLNTNFKWDSSDITPTWRFWQPDATEMLFNVTEAGAPDIRSVTTSSALLERCAFWESVSAFSAQ